MSVSYSLVKYVPKFGKNAGKGKFYARAQVNEKTSLKKFSKMIACRPRLPTQMSPQYW